MNRFTTLLFLPAILIFDLAAAQSQKLDICEFLLEEAWRPAGWVFQDSCDKSFKRCLLAPECCLPGCSAFPHCIVAKKVATEEGWYGPGDVSCSTREFTDRALAELVVAGTLAPGGNFDKAINIASDYLTWATSQIGGQMLPQNVQKIVVDLVVPVGTLSESSAEETVARIELVNASNDLAGLWIRGDADAITLKPDLIVMRDEKLSVLMDPTYGWVDTADVVNISDSSGPTTGPLADFRDAIDLMVHEVSHVAQYLRRGERAFREDYILQVGFWDRCENAFEVEAYSEAGFTSSYWNNAYCEDTRSFYEFLSGECRFNVPQQCEGSPRRGFDAERAARVATSSEIVTVVFAY